MNFGIFSFYIQSFGLYKAEQGLHWLKKKNHICDWKIRFFILIFALRVLRVRYNIILASTNEIIVKCNCGKKNDFHEFLLIWAWNQPKLNLSRWIYILNTILYSIHWLWHTGTITRFFIFYFFKTSFEIQVHKSEINIPWFNNMDHIKKSFPHYTFMKHISIEVWGFVFCNILLGT